MIDIKQIRLSKMATFCYLVGDHAAKTCALIDPAFETKRILTAVKENSYRVTHVINTHSHSDHTAGNSSILAGTGAKLLIHEQDAVRMNRFLNTAFSRILGGKAPPVRIFF
jgi:hydroxyacylglutathione hydrolase